MSFSFSSGGGHGCKKSLGKNKYFDDNWYIHLLYSVREVKQISDVQAGDVIILHRGMYLHFSVVDHTKNGDVICVDFHADDISGPGVVTERTFTLEEEDMWVLEVPDEDCYPREEVVRRAYSRLGDADYHIMSNNCEHFAMWCKTGVEDSRQVTAVGAVSLAGLGAVLLGAFSLVKTLLTTRRREDNEPA